MSEKIKTILVVEDDFSIRETIAEALESEGYGVAVAVNGAEGLQRMRELPKPCLVLLDMMMPLMGGREFLDAILTDAHLAPIPVLVVSAIADSQNTRGAAGFIKKPPDLDLLLKMVEQFTSVPPK